MYAIFKKISYYIIAFCFLWILTHFFSQAKAIDIEHIDIPIDDYIHFSQNEPSVTSTNTHTGVLNDVTTYVVFKPSNIQAFLSLPPGTQPLYYELTTQDPISLNDYKGRLGIWYQCNNPKTMTFKDVEDCLIYNQGYFVPQPSGGTIYSDYSVYDALTHYVGFEFQQGTIQLNPNKTFWRVYYQPPATDQLTPTPTPLTAPTCDADGDGIVNTNDFVIWKLHYATQTTEGIGAGDFNNDGSVDGLDYMLWLNQATPN